MKKLSLSLLLSLAIPAFAQSANQQWAVQYPGATSCQAMYSGTANPPVVGTDIAGVPDGSIAVPFLPMNGDQEVTDYSIVNGALLWNAPNGAQQANPLAVEAVIQNDIISTSNPNGISVQGEWVCGQYKQILDTYNSDPIGAQNYWALVKAIDSRISSADSARIEYDCANAGMTLVAAQRMLTARKPAGLGVTRSAVAHKVVFKVVNGTLTANGKVVRKLTVNGKKTGR